MTTVSRSATVPYSAEAMYKLVDDVPSYPQFLPWIKDAYERYRDADRVRATLVFAKGGFQKTFTTENRLQYAERIHIRLVEGPFRHLEGVWRFEPLAGSGSRVSLNMEFEFANRMLAMAFGRVFTPMAQSLVDSFCKRAHQLYG